MKLSELNKNQYQFTDIPTQGGGMSSSIPGFTSLSRMGATFGSEIGKAGLGLGESLLKGGKFVASKFSPKMAETFDEPLKATKQLKEGVFGKPFEKERQTGAGKIGQFLGMSAPFVAGTPSITRGQSILQNLVQPRNFITKAATQAVPEALGTGLTEFGVSGGDTEKAKTAGIFAGGTSGVLSSLGSFARATYFPELKNSVTRALGLQGKTTGGRLQSQIDKKIAGLSVLNKYAPDIKVKDIDGNIKDFTPSEATFDETLQAWNEVRKSVYNKYHQISSQLGKADFVGKEGQVVQTGINLQSVADDLNNVINSPRTSPYKDSARSILKDLVDNFGEVKNGKIVFKKTSPDVIESFLSDLYVPASSFITGKGERAYAEIAAGTAKGIRNALDEAIEGAGGTEYMGLRSEYSALKEIEGDLVRRFQQEARRAGGGLTDYAQIFNSGDLIAGLLSQSPALVAKGAFGGTIATILKGLKEPQRYLNRSFKLLNKGDTSGITERLFGGVGGKALSESDQKLIQTIKDYAKSPKLGMSIEDVSKGGELDNFLSKWVMRNPGERAPKLTQEQLNKITEEAKNYKPKESITVYRGTTGKNEILDDQPSSWTYSKETAELYAKERGGKVIKKVVTPDEVLLDAGELPSNLQQKYGFIGDEEEVILKPFQELKPYSGEKDLTTKILKDLEGKITVSKQYILDATNRGELKQVERDLIRDMVKNEGDTINVSDFAKKVKAELLPLKRKVSTESSKNLSDEFGVSENVSRYFGEQPRYENISLPDNLKGEVADYSEYIYESPIKTSAGDTHFSGSTKNYFGHTRIEDMADNKTRRVIEVQSDLYQKGNLEREFAPSLPSDYDKMSPRDYKLLLEKGEGALLAKNKKYNKLAQYNDPTAHFRMVREEIKKAAQDGKTKLQFPTGETAMKIEGLGDRTQWYENVARDGDYNIDLTRSKLLTNDLLKVGKEINQSGNQSWIITDVLGDGKFKAVPKNNIDSDLAYFAERGTNKKELSKLPDGNYYETNAAETFDISGKVDTNNPIYKFYEKDVQKYLSKFEGKRIVDDKGVSWIEVPIKKEWAKMPVEAFALAPLMMQDNEK